MIPLRAHIMIVADAIDAMTSNRIYQSRKTMDEAIAEIVHYRGIWYDPLVVDATVEALKTLEGDSMASQIPLTPIEEARFSYYFKDQLTGAYNEAYLKMIIKNLIPEIFYNDFVLVEIKEMSKYNMTHGWHSGDLFIQNICNSIGDCLPIERIFRVFGDDFVIACSDLQEAQEYLHKVENLDMFNVSVSRLSVDELTNLLQV